MKKVHYQKCKYPQYINPKLDTFYDCWWYLNEHALFRDHREYCEQFSMFLQSLDVEVVKVDPKNHIVDFDHPEKNTHTEIWLECGEQYFDEYTKQWQNNNHNTSLDCGGCTYEKAIMRLARIVQNKYPLKTYGKIGMAVDAEECDNLQKKYGKELGGKMFLKNHHCFDEVLKNG